ncbi:LysR family transcriptional regulator [Paenibacillus nanensis]|uniref:LysR family transcriptional regulator n=1 Tax=Paenibacillus nanensis TaxID=393251 RepID=A0A3A1VJ27_9BACL|nr:LysR family transcriptional regulator [Paenibacillus nanensis]RIX59626.1 LysR family transcriptional regulator [Paenibacillus nanensis]
MEMLQLQYFLTVARLEHMTEAARALHVTQSSLSRTIQRLEENVGAPLFHRTGRKLRLNEFGERFLYRAERALFELEQGRQEIRDLIDPEQGTLELAVTTASTLPGILRAFQRKRNNIQIHVQMLNLQEMVTLLHRGDVDFCLSSPPVHEEDFECRIVFVDPIQVAVPCGHRLAKQTRVSLSELREEKFVGVKSGYGIRDTVDAACKSVGFEPYYIYEGDEPARLSALVEAEVGIAFMPSTARDDKSPIRFLEIEGHQIEREIALLWHKSRFLTRGALDFREVVVEYFEELSKQ